MEGTLLVFSKRYYLFQEPIVIFQVPPCNKTKRAFKCWNSYYFFGLSGATIFIGCFIIYFHFIFRARCSIIPCVGKKSWSESICRSVPRTRIQSIANLRISILHLPGQVQVIFIHYVNILIIIFITFFYITVISKNIIFYISLCRSSDL